MRHLNVPLSPQEEVTLRRVALASTMELADRHLTRLRQLDLVEPALDGWRLTALGDERYRALLNVAVSGHTQAFTEKMREDTS